MPREEVISDRLIHETSATANYAIVISLAWAEMDLILTQVLWKLDLEWDEGNKDDWSGRRVWVMHEKWPLCVKMS